MREQHQHVDEYLVACALDLEVFEEDVDAEDLEGLVNYILLAASLEALIGRTIQLGAEGDEGQPAGSATLPVVEFRVQRLRADIITIFNRSK
jgi:hypothetical protein